MANDKRCTRVFANYVSDHVKNWLTSEQREQVRDKQSADSKVSKRRNQPGQWGIELPQMRPTCES
ncbi:hypothetical protein caldi_21460 [Caldinitratiruptor microaerophilus]|uniref:Uncharacterized protein n=1 Tax=Caldinitratiruptor microaerophilus TaxID=671077 RepID=A0AA35G8G8_9FIRM|nr:hypothetical protein caldi_21460 [Caldinitratiruptor microaerophilus]